MAGADVSELREGDRREQEHTNRQDGRSLLYKDTYLTALDHLVAELQLTIAIARNRRVLPLLVKEVAHNPRLFATSVLEGYEANFDECLESDCSKLLASGALIVAPSAAKMSLSPFVSANYRRLGRRSLRTNGRAMFALEGDSRVHRLPSYIPRIAPESIPSNVRAALWAHNGGPADLEITRARCGDNVYLFSCFVEPFDSSLHHTDASRLCRAHLSEVPDEDLPGVVRKGRTSNCVIDTAGSMIRGGGVGLAATSNAEESTKVKEVTSTLVGSAIGGGVGYSLSWPCGNIVP